MTRKIYTSLLTATVITSSLGTANVLAAPMTNPEQILSMENMDIGSFSSSLRKLGEQATLLQAYTFIIEDQPALYLPRVPALQDIQQLIQADTKEWRQRIFHRHLLDLNENNRSFINIFNTYVEQGNLEGIQKKLNSRKIEQQVALQQTINELEDFKDVLNKHQNSFTRRVQESDNFLNGGSGRIAELKKDIQIINVGLQSDLEAISSVPGILVNSGTIIGSAVWKLLYPVAKGGTQSALSYLATANKKLEDAKKTAIDKAKKDGIENIETERIIKEVEDNFAKSPEGLALEAKKYDFMDKIDIDQIKKIVDAEAAGNAALLKQRDAILSLAERNHQLFTLTQNLKATEIQSMHILFIESKVDMFAEQIDAEIFLLKKHQKDWNIIEQAITDLPQKPTTADLKTLRKLCKQLEDQIKSFNNVLK
ncbi:HBL/NHE enterotoxin family protein [Bacillus sp. SRB3LM]|uniref:HBL/NHE enterotoxin family protein n=1 Tax=Bacillus sp. SRB3LM TaxID=2608689 RepID=UPI0018C37D88|nr:HBL/NHE enterotoxin family protein [Bacillus sp. SRB3LM]MBG0969262.1 HBL/NHE enterotoxin family protein [Bacillus sp. SRB3LM]MBG0971069.1 HBL/NHE enterotoxin family protein [Bacillus sp. SRB3LM]